MKRFINESLFKGEQLFTTVLVTVALGSLISLAYSLIEPTDAFSSQPDSALPQ